MQKRRKLLWMLVTLVFAGIFVYCLGVYQVVHFNSQMEIPETGRNHVTTFKLYNGELRTAGGVKFYLDMGSRHNFITPATLRDLHAHGCKLRERPTLVLTVDPDGKQQIFLRKVSLNLELPDSLSTSGRTEIRNVEMFISDEEDGNILGMDFLERFCVECKVPSHEISLYRYAPDDYVQLTRLRAHGPTIFDRLGYSKFFCFTMRVNDEESHNYYLDTGRTMRNLALVQPARDTLRASTRLKFNPEIGAPVQPRCRIHVADRLKFGDVAYADELSQHDYTINPFVFFSQDFVVDFPQKRIMMHRTSGQRKIQDPVTREPIAYL